MGLHLPLHLRLLPLPTCPHPRNSCSFRTPSPVTCPLATGAHVPGSPSLGLGPSGVSWVSWRRGTGTNGLAKSRLEGFQDPGTTRLVPHLSLPRASLADAGLSWILPLSHLAHFSRGFRPQGLSHLPVLLCSSPPLPSHAPEVTSAGLLPVKQTRLLYTMDSSQLPTASERQEAIPKCLFLFLPFSRRKRSLGRVINFSKVSGPAAHW